LNWAPLARSFFCDVIGIELGERDFIDQHRIAIACARPNTARSIEPGSQRQEVLSARASIAAYQPGGSPAPFHARYAALKALKADSSVGAWPYVPDAP
jgi:hypothetical protein